MSHISFYPTYVYKFAESTIIRCYERALSLYASYLVLFFNETIYLRTRVSYRSINKKKIIQTVTIDTFSNTIRINEFLTQWYIIQLISKFTKRLIRREGEKRIFSQTQYSMITIDKILSITFASYCVVLCTFTCTYMCIIYVLWHVCILCPEAVSLSVWSHHNKTLVRL